MQRLEMLSVVAILNDIPAQGLVRGQVGTVVEVLSPDTALIDFTDQEGRTYAIEPVSVDMLIRLHQTPIKRVA